MNATAGIPTSTKASFATRRAAKASLATASTADGISRTVAAEQSPAGRLTLLPKDWKQLNRRHRATGIPRGSHPNSRKNLTLAPGRVERKQLRPLSPAVMQLHVEESHEHVGDVVSNLIADLEVCNNECERKMGAGAHAIDRMLRGDDFRFSTLARLAAVAGRRLVVSFEER